VTLTFAVPVGPSGFLQPFAAPEAAFKAEEAAARLNSAPPPAGGVSAVAVAVGGGVAGWVVVAAVGAVPEGLPVPVPPAGAVPPEDDFVVEAGSPPAGGAVFVAAGLFAATVSVGVGVVGVLFVGAAVCVVVAPAESAVVPFSAVLSPPLVAK